MTTEEIDGHPHGGHSFEQMEDHPSMEDHWFCCSGCHGKVPGTSIEDNTFQLSIGAYCPARLMEIA